MEGINVGRCLLVPVWIRCGDDLRSSKIDDNLITPILNKRAFWENAGVFGLTTLFGE